MGPGTPSARGGGPASAARGTRSARRAGRRRGASTQPWPRPTPRERSPVERPSSNACAIEYGLGRNRPEHELVRKRLEWSRHCRFGDSASRSQVTTLPPVTLTPNLLVDSRANNCRYLAVPSRPTVGPRQRSTGELSRGVAAIRTGGKPLLLVRLTSHLSAFDGPGSSRPRLRSMHHR